MAALPIRLRLDTRKFVDPELFGQSPIIDFLELHGFEYASESFDDEAGGYLYEVSGKEPEAVLTQEWLIEILKYFDSIEILFSDDGLSLIGVLPISSCLELRTV